MNRLVITGISLTAGLAIAGLAQAQTRSNPAGSAPAIQTPQSAPGPSMGSGATTPTPGAAAPPSGTTASPSTGEPQAQEATPTTPARTSHAAVREAQQALKSKGLYDGPIDGVLGRQTKTALSRFQQQNGLPETAMLDRQTMRRLIGSDSNETR